jgi:hypothetical protein
MGAEAGQREQSVIDNIRAGYPDLSFFGRCNVIDLLACRIHQNDKPAMYVFTDGSEINLPFFNLDTQIDRGITNVIGCGMRFSKSKGIFVDTVDSWIDLKEFNKRVTILPIGSEGQIESVEVTSSSTSILLIHEIVDPEVAKRTREDPSAIELIEQYKYIKFDGKEEYVNVYGVEPGKKRNVNMSKIKKVAVLDTESINAHELCYLQRGVGFTYLGPIYEFIPNFPNKPQLNGDNRNDFLLTGQMIVRETQFDDQSY